MGIWSPRWLNSGNPVTAAPVVLNNNIFYPLILGFRVLVLNKMEEMYQASSFHDSAELNQATQFLHENGVLLHYDDINLQNVYFLDPQWLCDVLANVVTIREINSLAKCGKNLVLTAYFHCRIRTRIPVLCRIFPMVWI